MKRLLVLFAVFPLLYFAGCTTAPLVIDEGLAPQEYFQKAQEAVVKRNDYDTALVYYMTFKERHPEENGLQIDADYEIGFIYYKKDQFDLAREKFNAILQLYNEGKAEGYYEWPRIMSEKILEKIEEKEAQALVK